MDGRRVVVSILVLVLVVAAITFGLYLLTRKDDADTGGLGAEFVPNAAWEIAAVEHPLHYV